LNNKLPQAKFDNKAKKTVGFATKKEIEAEDDVHSLKHLKKARS
jgi:hypothetical protein